MLDWNFHETVEKNIRNIWNWKKIYIYIIDGIFFRQTRTINYETERKRRETERNICESKMNWTDRLIKKKKNIVGEKTHGKL